VVGDGFRGEARAFGEGETDGNHLACQGESGGVAALPAVGFRKDITVRIDNGESRRASP